MKRLILSAVAAVALYCNASAVAQASTSMPKFDDCMANDECKLEAARAICGDDMKLKAGDIDRATRGSKAYVTFNEKVASSCGKKIAAASPDVDGDPDADGDVPAAASAPKERHAGMQRDGSRRGPAWFEERAEAMLRHVPKKRNHEGHVGVRKGHIQPKAGCRETKVADRQAKMWHVRVVCDY